MSTNRQWVTAGVVLGALGMAACAQPPTAQIDAARASVTAAQEAGAEEYAPEALHKALEAQEQLEAELAVQQDKMAFLRSYAKAGQLAVSLASAGDAAVSQAASAKEHARQQAASLIERLKTDLAEVTQLLEDAPKGKGAEADVEAMKAEMAAIAASMAELEQEFASGAYKAVTQKAEAALEGTGRVRGEVLMAAEAVRLAKPGRKG